MYFHNFPFLYVYVIFYDTVGMLGYTA